MIPKRGKDLRFPQNYRPIGLLPTMDKTVERIIKNRLETYTEDLKILRDTSSPSGKDLERRSERRSETIRVVEKIKEGFQRKDLIGAVLLDVEKALDRVWKDGLVHKLIGMEIPRRLIHLLESYPRDRTFQVRMMGAKSTITTTAESGVPQRVVLSVQHLCRRSSHPTSGGSGTVRRRYTDMAPLSATSSSFTWMLWRTA